MSFREDCIFRWFFSFSFFCQNLVILWNLTWSSYSLNLGSFCIGIRPPPPSNVKLVWMFLGYPPLWSCWVFKAFPYCFFALRWSEDYLKGGFWIYFKRLSFGLFESLVGLPLFDALLYGTILFLSRSFELPLLLEGLSGLFLEPFPSVIEWVIGLSFSSEFYERFFSLLRKLELWL